MDRMKTARSLQSPVDVRRSFRMKSLPVIAFSAVLALVPFAYAQVAATVSGTITDQSKAVVSGATVAVKNTDTGIVRSVMTDGAGHYQVVSLPVGDYEIDV